MNRKTTFAAAAAAVLAAFAAPAIAHEDGDVPHLDHVFVVMMENHAFSQIIGNANAPFINSYAKVANQAANYYAVGHPSAPNYLEIVGGCLLYTSPSPRD